MTLSPADVIAAIDRYLSGELTEAQLIAWADGHECQEYVEDADVGTALFELATPEINGAITPERVREIRANLA